MFTNHNYNTVFSRFIVCQSHCTQRSFNICRMSTLIFLLPFLSSQNLRFPVWTIRFIYCYKCYPIPSRIGSDVPLFFYNSSRSPPLSYFEDSSTDLTILKRLVVINIFPYKERVDFISSSVAYLLFPLLKIFSLLIFLSAIFCLLFPSCIFIDVCDDLGLAFTLLTLCSNFFSRSAMDLFVFLSSFFFSKS